MKKKIIIASALFIAIFLTSFFATGTILGMPQGEINDENSLSNNDIEEPNITYTKVSNVEQASEIAGYSVESPNYLPEIFSNSSRCIHVMQFKNNQFKPVIQMWSAKDGTQLYLISDPKSKGIGGGEAIDIFGTEGEQAYYGKEYGRDIPLLCLFWQTSETAYTLCGTIVNSLSEDEVYKIASSMVMP